MNYNIIKTIERSGLCLILSSLFSIVYTHALAVEEEATQRETIQRESLEMQSSDNETLNSEQIETKQMSEGDTEENIDRACPGCGLGEVMNSYSCGIEGYSIQVIRPASLPTNSNGRIIVASKGFQSFYVAPVEVPVLGGFYSTPTLGYYIDSLGFQDGDSPYCDRQGYPLKNTNVYRIQRTHGSNYNGQTNILYDSNIDSYSREQLVTTFNQNVNNPNVDTIPINCQGCIGNVDPIGNDDDGPHRGTYTTADGVEHDLWDMLDDDGGINDDGGFGLPMGELEEFRLALINDSEISQEQKEQILMVREVMMQKAHATRQRNIEASIDQLDKANKEKYETVVRVVENYASTQKDATSILMMINRLEEVINQYNSSSNMETQQGKLLVSVFTKASMILEDRYQKLVEEGSVTDQQLINILDGILGNKSAAETDERS